MKCKIMVSVGLLVLAASGCESKPSPASAPEVDPATEVRQVAANLDKIKFPEDRNEAKLRAVFVQINSIDISRCPKDYQAAYVQLASATGEFIDYIIETNSWDYIVADGIENFIRGFTVTDPFGKIKENRARARLIQAKVREATANYLRTLAKYK